MRARIWKDRKTGWWRYQVRGHGLRSAGHRSAWNMAVNAALSDLAWIDSHKRAWRM